MSQASRSDLRRPRKEEVIIRDILNQLQAGTLNPGDRLASIKDLCATYHVSQRIVDSAISELVDAGVVMTQHRRGCFLTATALTQAQALLATEPGAVPATSGTSSTMAAMQTAPANAGEGRVLTDFLVPRSDAGALTVFLSEIFPTNLRVWRQVLDEFSAATGQPSISILSCLDGHPGDVLANRHADVVQTTSAVLQSLGADRFVPNIPLDALDVTAQSLLPPVRQRLAGGNPLLGVPYSLTLTYLYVNLDLMEAAGLSDFAPTSIVDWVRLASQCDPQLRRSSTYALQFGPLFDWLVMAGAVWLDADGAAALDEGKALELLEAMHGSGLQSRDSWGPLGEFVAGRSMTLRHCSYEVIELMSKARFRWKAIPLPVAPGIVDPCWITVLAVNRQSPNPQRCLDLLRHLMSPTVQRRFAAMHGNLPVCEAATFSADGLYEHPILEAVIRQQLEQSTALWSESRWPELQRHLTLQDKVKAILDGQLSPTQLLEQIKVLVRFGA